MLTSQRKTFIEETVEYHREKDRKIVEKLDQAFIAYKKGASTVKRQVVQNWTGLF